MLSAREIWDALAASNSVVTQETGWYLRRVYPRAVTGIFVALRLPEAVPALLLEVSASAVPPVREYPSGRGFAVYPESITPGPRGRTRLCLVLADARYRDVLEVLVNDVSQRVASAPTESEAVKTFIARLHVWQNFMRKHAHQGLPSEAQVGLFGELLFLLTYLLPLLPAHDAVTSWNGPSGASHDFDIRGHAVEVKTSTTIPPVTVHIANVIQLDDHFVASLLLCHVSLALDPRRGENLPQLVDRLRTNIERQGVSALDGFNSRLIEAGYLDSHSELYSDTRYGPQHTRFYNVISGFPRIVQRDLHDGISHCSYSVLIAACAPYDVTDSDPIGALLLRE